MDEFDVIIIGSGIGGLMSSGLLASKGMKPLVIESHNSPGGYLSSFRRKDFIFDSAVDCISGIRQGEVIGEILSLLDVDNRIEFLKVDPIRRSIFPDFSIDVYSNIYQYIKELKALFPAETAGIDAFFSMADRAYCEAAASVNIFADSYTDSFCISSELVKLKMVSYEKMLREYISDSRLIAVLSDRCPFIGLEPSKVSALQMIMLVMSYFKLGAYRARGGFQALSDSITEGIHNKGGKVLLSTRVKRITYDKGFCNSVICDDGNEYRCRYLISNADFIDTFTNLLGDKYSDVARKKIDNPGISTSFFIVYGIIAGQFREHSSIGYFPSYDFSSFFSPESAFKLDNTIGITVASNEDLDRTIEGHSTIVLHEMMSGNVLDIDREKCTAMSIDRAERAVPDLKGRIEVLETAAPSTLHRYTNNYQGAAFGWKQVPGNFMSGGHDLKNLYIAGHWGDMGGGVLAAAYSGSKSAADILRKEGISVNV